MQIRNNLLLASLLISGILSMQSPAGAQHVVRHSDGTVDVSDDATPVTHSSGRHHGSSGRIPAYTRREGGVTVRRHADGTVDIVDDIKPYHYTSTRGGHSSSRHHKSTHHHSHKSTHSGHKKKK